MSMRVLIHDIWWKYFSCDDGDDKDNVDRDDNNGDDYDDDDYFARDNYDGKYGDDNNYQINAIGVDMNDDESNEHGTNNEFFLYTSWFPSSRW